MPVRPKDPYTDPDDDVAHTNAAYLSALEAHLRRHPDAELLAKHMSAVTLCADALVRLRWEQEAAPADAMSAAIAQSLKRCDGAGRKAGDDANVARWESEAAQY